MSRSPSALAHLWSKLPRCEIMDFGANWGSESGSAVSGCPLRSNQTCWLREKDEPKALMMG